MDFVNKQVISYDASQVICNSLVLAKLFYMLACQWFNYNSRQKSLGHLEKTDKNSFPLHMVILATNTHPLPPRTMLIRLWYTSSWRAGEFFPLSHVLLQKTNIAFGGEGDESSLQNTKSAKCPRTVGEYCTCF